MINKVWSKWKKFGRVMGDFFARNILTLFFFTIALPFGLIMRITQDSLNLKPKEKTNWTPNPNHGQTIDEARRLF